MNSIRLGRVVWVLFAACVGWCAGWIVGAAQHSAAFFRPSKYPFLAESVPMPHRVPKYAGGASFRFAMVHDVIHERFAKHGPDYYRERDRLTREKINKLAPDDPARFALWDDLGVGLDRLGRSDEAVAVLRAKLALQEKKGLTGRDLYTSHANLGTFLVHANVKKAATGDATAQERFREGVALVRKSVEVNPEAHFGREQWQAALAEFLFATTKAPQLLKTYDCLGNRLGLGIGEIINRETNWVNLPYGRPFDPSFSQGKVDKGIPEFFAPGVNVEDPALWAKLKAIREHITKFGAETGWEDVDVSSLRPEFNEELAYGEGFQKAYQEFEAAQIKAGVSIYDEHFYDSFPRKAESIASNSGPEESYLRVPREKMYEYAADSRRAWSIFGAGAAAFLTAIVMGWKRRNGPG